MKVGSVTKFNKRNITTSKKLTMKSNCDVQVIFPIKGKFGAIRKPDSGRIVCKTHIFINSNLLLYKNSKQNYKISNTALMLLLSVKILFLTKIAIF